MYIIFFVIFQKLILTTILPSVVVLMTIKSNRVALQVAESLSKPNEVGFEGTWGGTQGS
jgi:hypothetical protein